MFGAAFTYLFAASFQASRSGRLEHRETAKVMEVSHGTVKARLARARAKPETDGPEKCRKEGVAALP